MIKITDEQLIAEHRKGLTAREIMTKYNILTDGYLYKRLNKLGLKPNKDNGRKFEDIRRLRENGLTCQQIADTLGKSKSAIKRTCRVYGWEFVGPSRSSGNITRGFTQTRDSKKAKQTLLKLYQRDNGVCYLCGGLCDWNDCKKDGKQFTPGKTYPTIDHLVALSKGGDDRWENVKLAHHFCNAKKGNTPHGSVF